MKPQTAKEFIDNVTEQAKQEVLKSKRKLILNVNLEYDLPDDIVTPSQINDWIIDLELPKEYISDSLEMVGVREG